MEFDNQPESDTIIVKFCSECNNILIPNNEDRSLVYRCIKPSCPFKLKIEGRSKQLNLVSSKLFSLEKNLIIDRDFVLDPTMPREKVECPECHHFDAVFLISSDVEDTILELIYICANRECGHIWKKETVE